MHNLKFLKSYSVFNFKIQDNILSLIPTVLYWIVYVCNLHIETQSLDPNTNVLGHRKKISWVEQNRF